jgi:hypothetical protein
MASCANITLEKIRASIQVGDKTFVTPDIKSFNVTRSRSALAATFSASIEVPITQKFSTGSQIIIKAGTEQAILPTIFTGTVTSVTVNPAFEKAASYIITLSGADRFRDLEGKNISRRQRTRAAQSFAAITSITKRPQKGIAYDVRIGGSSGPASIRTLDSQLPEDKKVVNTDRPSYDPLHNAKKPEEIDDESGSQSGGGTGSIRQVRPSSVAIPVGGKVRFVTDTSYDSGDSWTVSDEAVGTIEDRQNGTAIYTQIGLGENVVRFNDSSAGSVGTATALGIPIHDHSSLGQGGPAFGVYASE